jgi:aryl-alcohol dehydrogenase-like predicted oxidoreductase
MRYVRLAGTDLDVSTVALGCGNFGGIGWVPELFGRGEDEAAAFALMDAAREHGITLFDTANTYGWGRSEEWIGRWLASRSARHGVVLSTKVRNRVGPGPDAEGLSDAPDPYPGRGRRGSAFALAHPSAPAGSDRTPTLSTLRPI